MALEARNHSRVIDLLKHAKSRKAYLVYLPYFEWHQVPRITRVMPSVFDCLELADLVVARNDEIAAIFPDHDIDSIFKDHIHFYCPRFLDLEPACQNHAFLRRRQKLDEGMPSERQYGFPSGAQERLPVLSAH